MQYDDFIGEVQQRAQLDSREAALSVSRATLSTLSERIDPGQAENLGAQLPDELARFLEEVDDAERFDHGEFVDRVGDREEIDGADDADAAFHARAVVDVLDEAVTGDALEDVTTQLPTDEGYDNLFEIAESNSGPA